jgi:hypothetical protein
MCAKSRECYFRPGPVLRTPHRLATSLGALGALAAAPALLGAMLGGLVGCGGDEDPSTPGGPNQGASTSTAEQVASCTPIDAGAPAPCPQPQPSFARDIAPLLDRECNNCHTPGSTLWPLVGYENVRDWSYSILLDLDGCRMPPADGGTTPLSAQDRALVVGWIVCGANNN